MSNWELNYSHGDEWEWYHPDWDEHYLLVAQAGPHRDEDWYVLPYIGTLSPSDHRYDGPDRRTFGHIHEAQKWADKYLASHPEGHEPDELEAEQQSYNAETGEVTSV